MRLAVPRDLPPFPRQEDTDWAGGLYKVTMEFTEDYPSKVCLGRIETLRSVSSRMYSVSCVYVYDMNACFSHVLLFV